LGIGTTFYVYWPTSKNISENIDKVGKKQEYYLTGGNETILLVEDDADVRELVQSALENYGYVVNTAVDGMKGLEYVENDSIKIDLIVTDMIMPNLNGKELGERALKIRPDLKILYTSGYTDDQLVTNGEMDSEIDFLQKPYSVVILLKKVREILDRDKI
jgi:DNA-binding NtrC family response regulator